MKNLGAFLCALLSMTAFAITLLMALGVLPPGQARPGLWYFLTVILFLAGLAWCTHWSRIVDRERDRRYIARYLRENEKRRQLW